MSNYTTTKNFFPVKDVTHKPKRMQGDMIKIRERELGIVSDDPQAETEQTEGLSVVTLERAITYYKKMSSDQVNGNLYSATAKWLEELLVTRTLKTEAVAKAVIKGENINESEDNINREEEEHPV